jgi:AmpD protein
LPILFPQGKFIKNNRLVRLLARINGYDCEESPWPYDKRVKLDPSRNRLLDARQRASPNFDERPADCELSLIVIHGISLPPGEYGGPEIDRFFTNTLDTEAHPYFSEIAHLRVSSHLLIRRDGEVVQYVPFLKRAWHAGQSSYDGCEACNDFSIGIELEGQDEEAYAAVQYQRLAEVIHCLNDAFPDLSTQRVAGHCDIAPHRKTDPGPAFDWAQLRQQLAVAASGGVGPAR